MLGPRFLNGEGDLERAGAAASLLDDEDEELDDDDLDDEDDEEELREPAPAPLESEPESLDRDLLRDGLVVAGAEVFFLFGLFPTPVLNVAEVPLREAVADAEAVLAVVVPLRRLLPDALLLPVDIGLLLPLSFRYCEQFNWPKSAVVMPLLTIRPLLRAGDEGASFQLLPVTETLRL